MLFVAAGMLVHKAMAAIIIVMSTLAVVVSAQSKSATTIIAIVIVYLLSICQPIDISLACTCFTPFI